MEQFTRFTPHERARLDALLVGRQRSHAVHADIIAEGQSDPSVLREYRERYVTQRRAFTREVIARAKASGEFKREIDPETLIDMVYGPIYYRLLVGHQKVDRHNVNAEWDENTHSVAPGDPDRADTQEVARS